MKSSELNSPRLREGWRSRLVLSLAVIGPGFIAANVDNDAGGIYTAYAACEGLGLESGLDKRFEQAPIFYWLYTVLIVAGAGVLLLPHFPLIYVMVLSQVVNGMVLPFVLIFVLLLTNDHELMGETTSRLT
jgi:Mn2+/Fe2+ NRAMP family transporter